MNSIRWKKNKTAPKKRLTVYDRCPFVVDLSFNDKFELCQLNYCCKVPEWSRNDRKYCFNVKTNETTKYANPSYFEACKVFWASWLIEGGNSINDYLGIPPKSPTGGTQLDFFSTDITF